MKAQMGKKKGRRRDDAQLIGILKSSRNYDPYKPKIMHQRSNDTMRKLKQVLLAVVGTVILTILIICSTLPGVPRIQQRGYGSDFKHKFIKVYENISLTGPTVHNISRDVEWLEDLSYQDICNKTDPFILAVVISAIPNIKERNIIRKTWAHPDLYQFTKMRTIFVVGATKNDSNQKVLEDEMDKYQDIIQYDYIDSYRNLTYKTISWMSWVQKYCVDVPWIAKIDDDIVVNPFNLNRYLVDIFKKNQAPSKIHGRLRSSNKPLRYGKYCVTKEEYPPANYPPFVLGPAYIVGRNAIDKLLKYAPYTPFLWLEDVFMTGLVAKAAGVGHVQADKQLYTKKITRRLYSGRLVFFVGATDKSRRSSWVYIVKYGPTGKKRR